MKKVLVIGVILLFLGVGFQPALANEISTNIVSDVDEDCLECQPINRVELLRVKLLLITIEVITNVILSKFGHIPEVAEKCQEILEIIDSNRQWDYPLICVVLIGSVIPLFLIIDFLNRLYYKYFEEYPIIGNILDLIVLPIAILIGAIYTIMYALECI